MSNMGMLLKSSLVFVMERPGKWALPRAYEVTKVPPITSLSLFEGDSNNDLNLITFSSRSFTYRSVDSSKSCCFCRSICSSLCSFYSSSSFWRSSISSNYVSNLSSRSSIMYPRCLASFCSTSLSFSRATTRFELFTPFAFSFYRSFWSFSTWISNLSASFLFSFLSFSIFSSF